MIGTRERQQGTVGAGRLFTLSEGDVNNLRTQMAETLGDVLAVHTEVSRELLAHLRGKKKRIRVDYFRSTATSDSPNGTGLSLTLPNSWIPAPAEISTIIVGVGGSAGATLQLGRRIFGISVAASIPNPQIFPLGDESGFVIRPNDAVKLSVPSSAVVLSLELIGYIVDPNDPDMVVSDG